MWLFITHPYNPAVITLHFMIGAIVKGRGVEIDIANFSPDL